MQTARPNVQTSRTDGALYMRDASNFALVWGYLRTRKRFWVAPIVLFLLVLSLLLVFAQGSAVAPFIYTIF